MNEELNLKALFLGSKSENKEIFEKHFKMLLEDHTEWRKNYHVEDDIIIDDSNLNEKSFKKTVNKMDKVLVELSKQLKSESVPQHSPRFLGHMNSETLMPAILGYFGAMLYNSNNVSYEASPATSKMEEEVGEDFAKLMGYKNGWGHISAGGSIANLEGLWYARNIKSIPIAIKEVIPELVEGKSEWELLNFKTEDILDLLEKVPEKLEDIKNHSSRSGKNIDKLGKWLVPQTKHYSWLKAADIVGIGLDNVVAIDVNDKYRMDIDSLENKIRKLTSENIPILGVVGVVGSTEEGAVDDIHEIIKLRKRLSKEGINFYVHVDAAYGGYGRAIFLDENFDFISIDKLKDKYLEYGVFLNNETEWPSKETYEAFKGMSEADSITIDPHKMGYVPYTAGGIVIKDKRMKDIMSYFASYVFEKGMDIPVLLGAFTLEGSKAGATAASVWAAHKTLPLNITGYGKLIGASIEGAFNLYTHFKEKEFKIGNKNIIIHPLVKPDFNVVDFVFNEKGNSNLIKMNKLNHDFYNEASYIKGGLYENDFIVSHTDFTVEDYGDSPVKFIEKCGISKGDLNKERKVTILRSCVLSPYLNDKNVFDAYIEKIDRAIQSKLENIYNVR